MGWAKKIIILFVGFILVSSVLLNNQSFAVDYRDSTGYAPSWAKGYGYHTVLTKCSELIGDFSKDGNWCAEWVAYVLDQGIENFPTSAMSQGTYSSSTPIPDSVKLLSLSGKKGPVEGQWVKFEPFFETYSDPSLSPVIEKIIPSVQQNLLGITLSEVEWYEIKVENVEGDNITLKNTLMRNGVLEDAGTHTMKLQSEKPSSIIDTNIFLGKTLETPSGFAPITLTSIKNTPFIIGDCFVDSCKTTVVETMNFISYRESEQNNLSTIIEIEYLYEKNSGMLLSYKTNMDFTNMKNFEFGYIEAGARAIDFSTNGFNIINSNPLNPTRDDVLKELSEYFVRFSDGRYWFTNEVVSNGGKEITFDIKKAKNGQTLGFLTIKGNPVTSVYAEANYDYSDRSSSRFTSTDEANDILQIIRIKLIPNCCAGIDNHNSIWLENEAEGQHSLKRNMNGIEYVMAMDGSKYGGYGTFSQEITFPVKKQSSPLVMEQKESKPISELTQNTEDQSDFQYDLLGPSQAKQSIIEVEDEETPAWAIAVGILVVLGIPAIIIGFTIWKIKQRKKKNQIRSSWKGS